MAAVTAVLVSLNIFFSNFRLSDASTHWVVTEDGKIQAQMDSVFNMKRPYDLVAFMKQEERASMLDKLKQELLSRKVEIDSTEDRDTGLEEKFYKTDKDCLAAGKQLPDLDLYISTVLPLENKGIRPEDYLPPFVSDSKILSYPDCTHYVDLPYSPYAFEHLDGMRDRHKLPGSPELGLKNAITYQDNVEEYGHRIYEALQKNQTSWVLYNMAAFYWRIKGDPYNVIECVRRALHYSPRKQKDVALISLANVLHRAQKSNEAAIVVHAALDVSKELNVNHFTLGNIYAVLGEYNKSVICFENTLRIQPDFEAAAKRKHAVICHARLEFALEAQHRSLQRTLNDLKDYQRKHDYWQQQSDKLLAEQVPLDVKLAQHSAYEDLKIKEISTEIGEYCRMGGKDGKQVLMCSWGKKVDPAIDLDLTAPGDQPNNEATETEDANVQELTLKDGVKKDYTKPIHQEKYTFETVKVPRFQGVTPDYLTEEWPSKEECDIHVKKVPDARNLTSSYFPPEDVGYEIKSLLNEFLGLEDGQEHPLPWYPPVCVTLLDIPEVGVRIAGDLHSISYEQRKTIPLNLKDTYHTELLLSYVNDGKVTIEELGQRILSALKQRTGPKWILFNLAGLYWRIIGNNYHAIECFRRAQYVAPPDVATIPEVNLANVLYRWGRYDDALTLLRWGQMQFPYHPSRQFIWGSIEWARKNYTGAIYRYHLALEAEPGYTDVTNTLRGLKCYLRFHQAAQSAAASEEGGEERCVIETRTRSKTGNWHGHCGQCNNCCNRCTKCVAAASNSCQLPKGPSESPSNMNGIVLDGLDEDEIKDILEEAEFLNDDGQSCEDKECKVKIQKTSKFIKLEYVDGNIYEKAIFAHSRNELTIRPEDCVIFNDGTRSEGCSKPEFKAYVKDLTEKDKDSDSLTLFVNGQLTKVVPVKRKQSGQKEHVYVHVGHTSVGGTKTNEGGVDKDPPFQAHIVINNPQQGEAGDGLERKKEIRQLSDGHLPDTRKYIKSRLHLALPKLEDCRKTPKLDLRRFSSTWLSMSVKKINIKQHINFNEVIDKQSYEEPNCQYEIPREVLIDFLPGVQYRNDLEYYSETGLREVLQNMGGKIEPVEMVGTRIAKALRQNETSWVISNMAALYWRVRGSANKAIECLRIAVHSAPSNSKDVGLLSLANVLHKAKYINDAIIASSFILELSPSLVVGHFNIANLYAAKEQWSFAAMFYESTLGLQNTFEPAKQRLRAIQCMRIVQSPLPKE